MSSQYLYGDTNPYSLPVGSSQVVSVGDLIVEDGSGNAIRASDVTWNTSLAQTQADMVAKYVGVAAQAKRSTDAKPYGNSSAVLRVDTTGVFIFDCASATFKVGDRVGAAKDTGNALLNQTVVAVSDDAHAIGHVVEAGTSITRVKVRLLSFLAPAARQA